MKTKIELPKGYFFLVINSTLQTMNGKRFRSSIEVGKDNIEHIEQLNKNLWRIGNSNYTLMIKKIKG